MRINAIGAYFEKILSGFTFGTQTDQITVTGSVDLEASLIPGFEYTFPDKTGIIALTNDINYLTGATFNTGDGIISLNMFTGDTVTVDIDGRYALTGDLIANTDDYVTGATFNTGDGVLTLTRQSGATVTVDLDNRYSLTGHTHVIGDITDFTDNSTNWNSAYDDIITGATFNTGDGVLTLNDRLGDNPVTVDLDGRYLQSADTNTDDFTTGATFNTGDGVITYTRQSGSTYNVDIDGRYVTSVVGGVGVSSSGGLTPSIALTVDELAEKSGAVVGTVKPLELSTVICW